MYKLTDLQKRYAVRAREIASQVGIDPDIFAALIFSESSFRPDAVGPELRSGTHAVGIAQFLPETAKQFKIDPRDPEQSLLAAAQYLKTLYKRYGNYEQAVAAYKGFSDVKSPQALESFKDMMGKLYGGIKMFSEMLDLSKKKALGFPQKEVMDTTASVITDKVSTWLVWGFGALFIVAGAVILAMRG
jgi:soluble lytic murein transglycosylase-like protein